MHFFKYFIYLSLERGEGREETWMFERKSRWLPLAHPKLGTWPATQACALTRNRTGDLSVCGTMPNPLSHTSQGSISYFKEDISKLHFFSRLDNLCEEWGKTRMAHENGIKVSEGLHYRRRNGKILSPSRR